MSLASVKLPSTLSSIGQFAFAYCPLTDITNASLIPQPIGADTFTDYTGTLHVSMNALEAYKTAEYWKNFSNIVGDMLDSGIAEMGCPQNVSVNGYYDVCGRKLSEPVKGLNIVVMSDGSYRKVLIK